MFENSRMIDKETKSLIVGKLQTDTDWRNPKKSYQWFENSAGRLGKR